MSVHPQVVSHPGTVQGNTRAIADLNRKLNKLIARNSLHPGSVKGSNVDAATLTGDNIAPSTVTADNIVAGTITGDIIDVNTITAGNIVAGTITANEISAHTITANEIMAGTITATEIQAGTITAVQIAAGTITGGNIAGGTITGGNIAGATITGANVASGTITAGNITVANLSSLSANMGTLTSGIIQTAASGPRIMMGTGLTTPSGITQGIVGINNFGVQTFSVDAATGNVVLTGTLTAQSGSAIPTSTVTGFLPGSANRYSNSAFQDGAGTYDTTTWTLTGFTAADGGTTAPPIYGNHTLKTTATGATPNIKAAIITDPSKRVTVGLSCTFSHYVYPTTTAGNSRVDVQWYDSSGTQIGSDIAGTAKAVATNAWTRVVTTATAPASAAYGRGVHYVSTAAATNDVSYVQCMQMEQGDRESAWAPRPDEILYNSISALMIQANTITANQISSATITSAQIAAGTITATNIAAGTITGTLIAGTTITGTNIAANTITGTNIAANTIAAANIVSNTITATQIASNTIDTGQLTATAINGMTITGSTLQTSSGTISAVRADSAGIRAYDASGVLRVNIDSATGSLTCSKGVFTGSITGASGTFGDITIDSSGITGTYFSISSRGDITNFNIGTGSGVVGSIFLSSNYMTYGIGASSGHIFQIFGSTAMSITSGPRVSFADGLNVDMGTGGGSGVTLGTAAQKLSFYGNGPIAQPSTTNPGGLVNGTGVTIQAGFTSTGSSGSTAYTFNGVVRCLKDLGLIAA